MRRQDSRPGAAAGRRTGTSVRRRQTAPTVARGWPARSPASARSRWRWPDVATITVAEVVDGVAVEPGSSVTVNVGEGTAGGSGGPTSSADITDATATGRAVLTAADGA